MMANTLMGVGLSEQTQTETMFSARLGSTTFLTPEKGRGASPYFSLVRHLMVSRRSKLKLVLAGGEVKQHGLGRQFIQKQKAGPAGWQFQIRFIGPPGLKPVLRLG